jgi:hypothetical protein
MTMRILAREKTHVRETIVIALFIFGFRIEEGLANLWDGLKEHNGFHHGGMAPSYGHLGEPQYRLHHGGFDDHIGGSHNLHRDPNQYGHLGHHEHLAPHRDFDQHDGTGIRYFGHQDPQLIPEDDSEDDSEDSYEDSGEEWLSYDEHGEEQHNIGHGRNHESTLGTDRTRTKTSASLTATVRGTDSHFDSRKASPVETVCSLWN